MRYVKVSGEASYNLLPQSFIVDIEVRVQAAKSETSFAETQELAGKVVDILLENGIAKSEITGGGVTSFVPWWNKKSAGVTNYAKITITCENQSKAYEAIEKLNPLQEGKRQSISISERAPIFYASGDVVNDALISAYQKARNKACAIADECGCKIEECIWIQEGTTLKRGSGSYGDYDMGMLCAGPVAMAEEGESFSSLDRNKRIAKAIVQAKFEMVLK